MSGEPSELSTVLVTGSRGLIGSRFFELYGTRYQLISADLADGYNILDLEAARGKLSEDLGGAKLDAIVHLAAFTDVSAAHLQEGDVSGLCYELNVTGTSNMVRLANELDAHFVHISTDFVFSGKKAEPVTEEQIPEPIEWYGKTKLLAENLVKESALRYTMMRIAFPFHKTEGIRPDLVATITNKLRGGDRLYLFGDQSITPTFADDVVNAINCFIEQKPDKELFHVMGPEAMSPYDLGYRIADLIGCDKGQIEKTSLVEYLKKDPRPRQQYLAMDTSKYRRFCKEKGGNLPKTLEEALR